MTVLAQWNFDDPGEGATVVDDMGTHDGSVIGTVPLLPGPISSKKRVFDGSAGNRIEIPHSTDFELDLYGDRTFEVLCTPSVVGTVQRTLLFKGDDASNFSVDLGIDASGYWYISSWGASHSTVTAPFVAVAGELYYVAFTLAESLYDLIFYVQGSGVKWSSAFGGIYESGNTQPLMFSSALNPWSGDLHAVRVSSGVTLAKDIYNFWNGSNVREAPHL